MKKLIITLLALSSSCLLAPAQTLADYQGTVISQTPNYYFTLDQGSLVSHGTNTSTPSWFILLNNSAATALQTGYDVFGNSSNAFFIATKNDALIDQSEATDLVINSGGGGVATTNSTATGSISLLFKSLGPGSYTSQKYVFDGGHDSSLHNMCALLFQNLSATLGGDTNALVLRFGDKDTAILPFTNVIPDTWYYFAFTYTEATNGYFLDSTGTNLVTVKGKWYLGVLGGTLASGETTNSIDSVAGSGVLYLGNSVSTSAGLAVPGSGYLDEFATWTRRLSDAEVEAQFAKLPQPPAPGATYEQVVSSQFPQYYFKLNDSLVESVGNTLHLSPNGSGGAFTNDLLGNPDWAYSFSDTNDALFITNDLINGGGPTQNSSQTGVGTISLQFRMLSDTNNGGQRFIFAAPGEEVNATDDNQLALFIEGPDSTNYPNSLKLRVGNQTTGSTSSDTNNIVPIATAADLVPNAWYYFAMTYNESRNNGEVYFYFGPAGGTLRTGLVNPANASVVGDNGPLVIGNSIVGGVIQDRAFRNPGQGRIDNFAIWHYELSPSQINAQFAAMTLSGVPPTLSIIASGGNAILSWPATFSGYSLQSNTNLAASTWVNAGSAVTVGSQFVVTNAMDTVTRYYRLVK